MVPFNLRHDVESIVTNYVFADTKNDRKTWSNSNSRLGEGKCFVSGEEEERRRKRRKIFGKGKSDDGQTDVQNFLLFPSVEGVKLKDLHSEPCAPRTPLLPSPIEVPYLYSTSVFWDFYYGPRHYQKRWHGTLLWWDDENPKDCNNNVDVDYCCDGDNNDDNDKMTMITLMMKMTTQMLMSIGICSAALTTSQNRPPLPYTRCLDANRYLQYLEVWKLNV